MFSLQLNELVVGDSSGKLYIYKNDDCKPWITRTCVGTVRSTTFQLRIYDLIVKMNDFYNQLFLFLVNMCRSGRCLQQRKGKILLLSFYLYKIHLWWYHGIMMGLDDKTMVLIN